MIDLKFPDGASRQYPDDATGRDVAASISPSLAKRAALVALHGSWYRSVPDGYKVVLLSWDEQGMISESDFLSGFERDGQVIGRPVDVVEATDGSIFVSDDYAGAIYRLVPGQDANSTLPMSPAPSTVAARPDPLAGIDALRLHRLPFRGDRTRRQAANPGRALHAR